MQVTLKLLRYNPESDDKPHYQTFTVEADGTMKVPTGPGIGVAPDLGRIEALTVRRASFPRG